MFDECTSTRRQTLKTVGVLGGLACTSVVGTASAAGSIEEDVPGGAAGEWAQFQNNSQRTGYVPDVDISPNELSPKWRYLRGMTPPVYADGRLFVGDFLGILHALDAETGEPEWDYSPGDAWFLASVPVVTEETLVVGGVDGHLHAVDVTDGTQKWREEIPIRIDEEFPGLIPSNPTVYDDTVYIFGGFDVFAYDLEDGTQLWDEAGAADGWGGSSGHRRHGVHDLSARGGRVPERARPREWNDER